MNIYDTTLNLVANIRGMYRSLYWQEGYNDVGSFTIELPTTNYLKSKLQTDYYVKKSDRNAIMIIKTVQMNDNTMVISGKTAEQVLDDVAFIGTIPKGSDISNTLVDEYTANENQYHHVRVVGGDSELYQHQISNKSFLKLLETMCKDCDMGFMSVKNGNYIDIKTYKPIEKLSGNGRPLLVFSPERGNIKEPNITMSTMEYKNYAIVLKTQEGQPTKRVDIDWSNGGVRRDLIVYANDTGNDESETNIQEKMRAVGVEELLKQQELLNVLFSPPPEAFGKLYDIGDILTVALPTYNMQIKARVTKYSLTEAIGKKSIDIGVGNTTIIRRT